MLVQTITSYLESIAPLSLQEDYDNCGLLVGNREAKVQGVLTCLDCTEAVIDEAIEKHCNLIIAHHPIIFKGLKSLTQKNYTERIVEKAIRNDVSIYAIHTNLDNSPIGVNKKICDRLGIKNPKILAPKIVTGKRTFGSGMIGDLKQPLKPDAFFQMLKQAMKAEAIRHTAVIKKHIAKVAVCGGSGSFLIEEAIRQNADVLITADMKYHQFFDADNKLLIVDIGHYESEQFTKELLAELLMEKFSIFAPLSAKGKKYLSVEVFRNKKGNKKIPLFISDVNTNPINYL